MYKNYNKNYGLFDDLPCTEQMDIWIYGIYVKASIMSCVEYILTNYGMAQKQYSVSLKCCYTVGAFPIRQIYCVNTRNNYFIVFYYQFGVNVFCHDDKLNHKVYQSSTIRGNTTANAYWL